MSTVPHEKDVEKRPNSSLTVRTWPCCFLPPFLRPPGVVGSVTMCALRMILDGLKWTPVSRSRTRENSVCLD